MAIEEDILIKFKKVSPKEAVKELLSRGLKVTETAAETKAAVELRLFAITQSVNMSVLQDTRDAIAKAIKNGVPYKDFQANFINDLAAKGWSNKRITLLPDGTEKLKSVTPTRLKLVYDNAVSSSINSGRFKRFADNADDKPFLELHELQDKSARRSHKAKSGTIQPITAPVWKSPRSWVPPNGHKCRGWITSLTRAMARLKGIKLKRPGTNPDPGFGFNSADKWFQPKRSDFDEDIWNAGQEMPKATLQKAA